MRSCAFILAAVLLALPGCSNGPKTVTLTPTQSVERPRAGTDPRDPWSVVGGALLVEESERTRHFGASEARECPTLKLLTVMGKETKLRPGQGGFAEPGTVTLVVFWQMESTEGRAAAQHVSDLVRKYGRFGVRAVGIVERTPGATQAVTFLNRQRIEYPVHYDVLNALNAMRKAARADDPLGKLVAVFIVDRNRRVRFYRGEFPYSEAVGGRMALDGRIVRNPRGGLDTGDVKLTESTPEGHRIEDYLTAILNESY